MNRNGNCWDIAPAQSFFHTLKTELIHHRRFESWEQAKQEIFEYIEVFNAGSASIRHWVIEIPRS